MEFHPSNSRELLMNSLNHARKYIDIIDEKIDIILIFRKSIFTGSRKIRVKSLTDNFDVPMGANNQAQIADQIGIYILDTLSRIIDSKQIGLYRDDRLIFIMKSNSPKTSKIHLKIIRAFRLRGLKIEITSNSKIVNFLGVRVNLVNFKPLSESNHTPTYINVNSNHPKSTLKQIPNAVNLRINRLSSCRKVFEEREHIMKPSEKSG